MKSPLVRRKITEGSTMHFTDIFIRRPVLATVVSLLILVLGLRSISLLNVRQYPTPRTRW